MTINSAQNYSADGAEKLEENIQSSQQDMSKIIIYDMPEKFRLNKLIVGGSKSAGLVVLATGFLALLLVMAVAWFLFFNKPTNKVSNLPIDTATSTNSDATSSRAGFKSQSPKMIYFKMSDDIISSRNLADIINAMRKYGSRRHLSQLDIIMEPMNAADEEQKAALLSIAKINSLPESDAQDVQEVVNGDVSTLNITTKSGKTGVISFVFEDNAWKVDNENWQNSTSLESMIAAVMASSTQMVATSTADIASSTIASTTASTTTEKINEIIAMPGVDSDTDGVTDLEEVLLKTDLNKADSDADGYLDGKELVGGYDPASKGKLIDNKGVTSYVNKMYGYSTLYPSSWAFVNLDGESSVLIKSNDNQYFQIATQANTKKESITDWYKEQFSVQAINQANVVSGMGWQGIKSDNGLNVYLTNDKADNIFVISYTVGDKTTADYINLFNVMINSFSLNK